MQIKLFVDTNIFFQKPLEYVLKCFFMYKKKHNLLPTTIADFFAPENPTEHQYNLRGRYRNSSFRSNIVIGQKSIQNSLYRAI